MKTVIIGLDCGDPHLLFDRFRDLLPTISMLMEQGTYAKLQSIDPPITVPAWMSMMTGKTPGELGIYGFRNRIANAYGKWGIANSTWVKYPTLWDEVGKHGGESVVIGVPLTYPPKSIKGNLISCFMTPSKDSEFTYPPELKEELQEVSLNYAFDVTSFRSEEKHNILEEIYQMTRERIKVATHLMNSKQWELFVMVEIGTDRLHHAFWEYMDPEHILYHSDSPYANVIENYYVWLDNELEHFLNQIPNDAVVYIVSDHGAKRMDGGFRINQWLWENGYLSLMTKPEPNKDLIYETIDWEKTTAWGEGGYYGRLFVNLKDREPQGTVEPDEYEAFLDKIEKHLTEIEGPERWQGVRCLRPDKIYPEVNGIAPDMLVYAGDLNWRCLGTFGNGVFSLENDHGPDGANHSQDGIFLTAVKRNHQWTPNHLLPVGDIGTINLLDIYNMVLSSVEI